MSFAPDITEEIPAVFSARRVTAEATAAGVLYDLTLSGIGFVYAISSNAPYLRESIPVQKQQIDTSTEAGEQTLDGNWVRSQTSWHLGAGATYYEPGSRDEAVPTKYRFHDSRGVDVWTQGQLSLLPAMDAVDATALDVAVCGARLSDGTDVWYSRVGDEIIRHEGATATSHGSSTGNTGGGRICPAGSVILIGGDDGVYKTDLTGTAVTQLLSASAGAVLQPYWAKSRIIISRGPALHEETLASTTLGTALYTHPDSGWTWSAITETPDAILAAGYSGGTSAIYAFILTEDTGGTVPKLGQPFVVAEFPPGEEIRSIKSYLGRYLGIGTTAGVRAAVVGQNGQVQYGPLLVETDEPVAALAARDSFLYAAAGSSVIRVGLAQAIDDGLRFPYAYDVEVPSGAIGSVAFDGVSDRVVVGVPGVGTYAASATDHVSTGWVTSGDIRYGTTTPKAFRTIDVTADTPTGTSVAVSAVVGGVTTSLITLANNKSGAGVSLGAIPSPIDAMAYRLDLNGGADAPVVQLVAMRALPIPRRQRLIQYPVQIVDRGRDARQHPYGKEGYATILLQALEDLEDSQEVVTVRDLTRPEQYEAVIDKVEFSRVEPRARNGADNFGGIAKVTLRTL